jgi:hypothetical protein
VSIVNDSALDMRVVIETRKNFFSTQSA